MYGKKSLPSGQQQTGQERPYGEDVTSGQQQTGQVGRLYKKPILIPGRSTNQGAGVELLCMVRNPSHPVNSRPDRWDVSTKNLIWDIPGCSTNQGAGVELLCMVRNPSHPVNSRPDRSAPTGKTLHPVTQTDRSVSTGKTSNPFNSKPDRYGRLYKNRPSEADNDLRFDLCVEITALHTHAYYYGQSNHSMGWLPALPSP